ncbi:MAG: acyl-CoA dehydrogenase family protein [Deltaproteobacteria bacterium]|nr:acyl-CoA dehydrogenase family protein [Deltaproteobacteria bacterium]
MDFTLTSEQEAVRRTFRDFSNQRIRPIAAELDRHPRFPVEIFRALGDLGFFGMRYAPPLGSGADILSYLIAVEELARGSLGVAMCATIQSLMGTAYLAEHASAELRARLLAPALAGLQVGAICMTEPDAGSDLFAMTTRAEEAQNTWRVTGQKTWITSAPAADFFTVFARTGAEELSIFLVERGAPGLAVGRAIEKMGVRTSLTSEVSFDQTPAVLLGARGQGMESLRRLLAEIRVMTGALAVGVAAAALEDALAYAKERVQFGKPIAEHQAIQLHLAEMVTELEAARRMVHWAGWRSEQKLPNADESAMAKLFASEAALRICDRAARIMASYGYANDYPVERYLRDVRFTLIGGGTSEILKLNIARGLVR